jgi:hypothetical protein
MSWLEFAGGLFLVWLVLVFLFSSHLNYHRSRRASVHSEDFLHTFQSTFQGALRHGSRVTIMGPFVWILERQQ